MSGKETAMHELSRAILNLEYAIGVYSAAVADKAPQKEQTFALSRLSNAYLTLVESVKFLEPYLKDQEDGTHIRPCTVHPK